MKNIIIFCLFSFFYASALLADQKPGRFFEDLPDINDNYQVHFIYFLVAESEDHEWDINGKMANQISHSLEWIVR